MAAKALFIAALFVLAGSALADDEDYFATYSAQAPGDDPNTRGQLKLLVREDDTEAFEFSVELYNAIDVTGIHLHLEGNSSGGLYGGPLFIALTNTTAANNSEPVSSVGDEPLRANGRITSDDLNRNPQLAAVRTRVQLLGLDLPRLGIDLGESVRVNDLEKLIDANKIYTDVHTLERVSPLGLTRGRVTDDEDDDDDDDVQESASAASTAVAGSSDNGADEGDEGDDEGDDDESASVSTSVAGRKFL